MSRTLADFTMQVVYLTTCDNLRDSRVSVYGSLGDALTLKQRESWVLMWVASQSVTQY